jgi:toxin FitB
VEGFSRPGAEVRQVIILDTNIISALMLTRPDRMILAWLDGYAIDTLWLTSITILEIESGILQMPSGRKQRERKEAFARIHEDSLGGRVFPFDTIAAFKAAEFATTRRQAGRPVDFRDAGIAGIVAARGATFATRNVRDFDGFALDIVNPWDT